MLLCHVWEGGLPPLLCQVWEAGVPLLCYIWEGRVPPLYLTWKLMNSFHPLLTLSNLMNKSIIYTSTDSFTHPLTQSLSPSLTQSCEWNSHWCIRHWPVELTTSSKTHACVSSTQEWQWSSQGFPKQSRGPIQWSLCHCPVSAQKNTQLHRYNVKHLLIYICCNVCTLIADQPYWFWQS